MIDEEFRKEVARIVGHGEHRELLKREVSIVGEEQLAIRIPRSFAEQAEVNKEKDKFEFVLVPLKEGGFTIRAELKKHG